MKFSYTPPTLSNDFPIMTMIFVAVDLLISLTVGALFLVRVVILFIGFLVAMPFEFVWHSLVLIVRFLKKQTKKLRSL